MGQVRFANATQDDFVIARGDGTPLYNLAVAVDDAEMEITDVVRGDDHLSNTPKQLLVLAALGATPPRYAHLPLLHGPDGRKLSKRDRRRVRAGARRDLGYLPAAVRNYLALLGWGTEDDTTILADGRAGRAVLDRAGGPSAAVFDERKLRWMNGRFMRAFRSADYEQSPREHLRRSRPRTPTRSRRAGRAPARRPADRSGQGADARRGLAPDPVSVHRAGARSKRPGTR